MGVAGFGKFTILLRIRGRDKAEGMLKPVGLAVAMTLATGAIAQAQVFSSKNRAKLFGSQTEILDTRAASQYANSVRLQPPSVITPSKWNTPQYNGKYRGEFLVMARDAARK